ncbi:MAG TPA: hypothetical protein VKA89_09245 [Solirubrobacterales bacterium]|nr:hypothetical protein [Solirubrobacterales bacterium]
MFVPHGEFLNHVPASQLTADCRSMKTIAEVSMRAARQPTSKTFSPDSCSRASMRLSVRRLAIALVVFAAVGVMASSVSAKEYIASRSVVFLDAQTHARHRIDIGFFVKVHCEGGGAHLLGTGFQALPVDPKTGRFHSGLRRHSGSEGSSQFRVNGTAHAKLVTGRLYAEDFFRKQCRTGRQDDPWVRFAARPVTTYSVVTQGFKVEIKAQRRKVVTITGTHALHCSDGSTKHEPFGFNRRSIRNRGGWTFTAEQSLVQVTRKIRGSVHRDTITGQFSYRRLRPDPQFADCWSGRSLNDPWVEFVGRRQ